MAISITSRVLKLWRLCTAPLAVVCAGGLILRLTLRDRIPIVALWHYCTPWPVLACAAAVLARVHWRHRLRLAAWTAIAIGSFAMCFVKSWGFPGSDPAAPALRVVLWNVASPGKRMPGQVKRLQRLDPDIVALAEAVPRGSRSGRRWEEAFPRHEASRSAGNMLLLVRGEAVRETVAVLAPYCYANVVRAEVRGHALTVVQVDLAASLPRNRALPFPALRKLLERRAAGDAILLGDFNTPSDSIHFDPLRAGWHNAFDIAGRGYRPTWPNPFPVLDLDQIWTRGRIRAVSCESRFTLRSDHRPLIVDLAWDSQAPGFRR